MSTQSHQTSSNLCPCSFLPAIGLDSPTQSWRESQICRVELRRARMAKAGRDQLVQIECPLCGDLVMKKKLKFHTEYICCNRNEPPPEWLTTLERNKREKLAAKSREKNETIDCPLGCEEVILVRHLNNHLQGDCNFRLVKCRNPNCEIALPFCRILLHETYLCESKWRQNRLNLAIRSRERQSYAAPWVENNRNKCTSS